MHYGRAYLIFDELQTVEHWEKAIESFRLNFDVDIDINELDYYSDAGSIIRKDGVIFLKFSDVQ